jgi:diaminohydroxyphosphoribosylaminopyrimidine deaminase/5-amino-6-(5-phosphoribosylamino)uracil reductase
MSALDISYLHHALRIGARHLGRTWPNPSVGCVLVKDGQVIAAAATAETGRPHAETQALAQAGSRARGATAYLTLEPCTHIGQTPACAQALIDAGISRVVIACDDVDPRVAGKSDDMLRHAGITVEKILMPLAAGQHRGFFRRVKHGMPYVAMKLATSLDGQIRDHMGQSQWITGEVARAHGHRLRAQFDAIVTGIGTVLADDPKLTVRLPGADHSRLVRVICDRHVRLPLDSQLARSAETQPVHLITTAEGVELAASHANDLRERGVTLVVLEDQSLYPQNILHALSEAGLTRVLIEAGPTLSTAFLAAACVDTLYWYRAPLLLGSGGMKAVGPLDVALEHAKRAKRTAQIPLGLDSLEVYEMPSCLPG